MAEERRIAVMGATGYTGRLVVEELRRRSLPFIAAGRSAEKLRQLGQGGDIETVVAAVGDSESLNRLARRSCAIINCAGPFVDLGEPVVLAAIANGAHYLDTTGEQPFIRAMRAHDEEARRAGVAVVPAMAFEIALSDCAAAIAAERFTSVESVQVTYAVAMHASQGTQRTALRMLGSGGWAYLGGEWVEEPPGREWVYVDFPEPLGRVTAVSFPSAEVITIPWHIATHEVRAFMRVPLTAAWCLTFASPALPVIGRALGRFAGSLVGEGTGGPDAGERAVSDFHLAVDVRGVHGGRARRRRALLRGSDPYGITADVAVSGAECLCAAGGERAGVLAPASAVEPRPFLDSIRGVRWELSES